MTAVKPLNILIVDDLPVNLKLLKLQLEAEGNQVFEASNGAEALTVLDDKPVDLIISDILMPVMDGYRLCGEVRRHPRNRDLPFIFYTATYTSPADEELCLQLGADKYLRKPVPIKELQTAINEVLAAARRKPILTMEGHEILKEYSERLVFKLEQKNVELADAVDRIHLQATALDTAADAVLITDVEGRISWVNRAFCAATGYRSEEAIGRRTGELDVELHDAVFQSSFWKHHKERLWRGETAIRAKDGSVHYEEQSVTPVRAADGEITHFVGVMHDVTERKRTEEELRDAHAQLRETLEHSPGVFYAWRVEGETIVPRLVSENVTRFLGFQAAETLTFAWLLAQLHPDDRARAEASIEETLMQETSRTEYRLRHKNGTYRWLEDNRRLVRDAMGRPAELVGVWTDVTDRRRAQDELRESERRFSQMLNNLELVSIMLDRNARLTYCNDYFLRLTGWRREEIIGGDWFELFRPPENRDETRLAFQELLADSPEAWHQVNEIVTRSGERRLFQWNNSTLRSPSGELIGTASVAEDITDRRNLERQVLRAQRVESLGTLAGGIAHDLNNLFMPILMGASLLKRLHQDAPSARALENIEVSVKRGSELVKQVLLFARGSEGPHDVLEIGELVREIEAIARSTFPKDITIEVSIAEDLHAVMGDATQLTQVLLNLFVNARDAMPRGGEISISAANADITDHDAQWNGSDGGGSHVVLEVRDTGEGMPPEIIDRIFDPFFTTKEIGKGTGLGLSTVQGIMRSHGGFVTVSSIPGEGSTFRIHLPSRTKSVAAAAAPHAVEPPGGNGEWILLVDDDATVTAMTKQTLETFGYRVLTAEDGAQAIGVFSRHQSEIALVLTDMAMPVIDGAALIAALNRMDPDVKIVATTGNQSPASITKIAKSGVKYILAKPYTADHLIRTLADALAGSG